MKSGRSNDGTVIVNLQSASRVGKRVELGEIDHPVVLEAVRIWNEQRGEKSVPTRASMAPRQMKSFLDNLALVAIVGDEPDYEYKIVGDAAIVAFGQNVTGMRIDGLNGLEPGFGDVMARIFNYVRRTASPIYVRGILMRASTNLDEQQGAFLPLGANNVVDYILYVGGFTKTPPQPL
jgi:hypothetical protein